MTIGEAISGALAWLGRAEQSAAHFIEKEITMSLPQNITDAITKIKALLAGASDQSAADAQTISNLKAQVATLTQQLSDATGQLAEIEAALLGLVPAGS